MSYRWTAEEEHLLRLLLATNPISDIAAEFAARNEKGLAGFRSERSIDAIRRKCEREELTPESVKNYGSMQTEAEAHWEQIQALQDQYEEESVKRFTGILPAGSACRKILSLSDIHFPLARMDLLNQAVDDNDDADIVVLNGDIFEGYVFSSFEKNKRIAAIHEFQITHAFVKMLSERFPQVVLVAGNHDVRISRAIKTAGFPKEASDLFGTDLLARIANGEELDDTGMLLRKHDFSNVHYQSRDSWYVRIGKTIFIHPHSRGSSQPGFTVKKAWKDFFDKKYDRDQFDSIVCGHTHQIYKGVIDSTLLIEQGCFMGFASYAWSPKLQYSGSAMNGYAVIYQDADGNTDFNLSGPVFLGEVLPPKTQIIE